MSNERVVVHHYTSLEGKGKPWVIIYPSTRKRAGSYMSEHEAVEAAASINGDGAPVLNNRRDEKGTRAPIDKSKRAITAGIGEYLNEVERDSTTSSGAVYLGQLKGFPHSTTDPEVVERAIAAVLDAARSSSSAVTRLGRYQRARELRDALAVLKQENESHREHFIKHAAEWAAERGVTWGAFRDMGVSVAVLREAGVPRD